MSKETGVPDRKQRQKSKVGTGEETTDEALRDSSRAYGGGTAVVRTQEVTVKTSFHILHAQSIPYSSFFSTTPSKLFYN